MPTKIDFSQRGQPDFIRRFIPDEWPRWVVDVGAHDGLDGSNSRGFILQDWTALLIEPLPSVFEKLKVNMQEFAHVRLEQCACAYFEGTATFYIGQDGCDGQTSSLCEDEVFKQNRNGEEITVKVRTLTNLLTEHACPREFALLLVDAEGMDLEVLSGLDFSLFKPAVICTEVYEANPEKDRRKAKLLESNGYIFKMRIGSDAIWSRTQVALAESKELYSGVSLPQGVATITPTMDGVVYFDSASTVGGALTISGWGIAPDRTVPGLIFVGVRTENGVLWQESRRHIRSDVARHFGDPAVLYSGFVARFLLPVEYPVNVEIVQVEGGYRWDTAASLDVTTYALRGTD